MAEVGQHSSADDCWLVIDNAVYDVTDFIPDHPRGEEILKGCGKDATAMFNAQEEHQGSEAQLQLPELRIGKVEG